MTGGAQPCSTSALLPEHGPAAPPRSNGELVFQAPWEGRLFGTTMALLESGSIEWADFQAELVGEIARWESKHGPEAEGYAYYEHWLTALETTLERHKICNRSSSRAKAVELAGRPHGHDHR